MSALSPLRGSGSGMGGGSMGAVRSEISQARQSLAPLRQQEVERMKQEELKRLGIGKSRRNRENRRQGNVSLPTIGSGGGLPIVKRQNLDVGRPIADIRPSGANASAGGGLGELNRHAVLGVPPKMAEGVKKKKKSKKSKKRSSKESKTDRRERKYRRRAARTLQTFFRNKMKLHWAARKVQTHVRAHLAKKWVDMLRSAQQAGVMVAIRGTSQGKSGWYRDFDGTIYFFAVDGDGIWWQVVTEKEWEEKKEDELRDIPVLVCVKGTDRSTFRAGKEYEGKFREYGCDKKKPGVKRWKSLPDGNWKRRGLLG